MYESSLKARERWWNPILGQVGLVGLGLLLPLSEAWAPQFTDGPSVRVDPNVQVEFKWIADVVWYGKVEVFDNPDGLGIPLATRVTEDASGAPTAASQHTITMNVLAPLAPNTGYFFRVTATEPTGNLGDLVTSTPLPPFFTGAQSVSNVSIEADFETAAISWEANVIGYGSVLYGTEMLNQGPVEDDLNITDHAIELTGLSPGTTYEIQVSNKHDVDRDTLAFAIGQFTTRGASAHFVLTKPRAEPRVLRPNELSTLSARALDQGQPVTGVLVWFDIDPGSSGAGTFDGSLSTHVTTGDNGVASVQMTATRSGLVRVKVSSSGFSSDLDIPIIVR